MIPQYEPLIDRKTLAKETSDYILGTGFFTEYKKTEEFEQELAKVLRVKYCSVVNNGTISLSLALLAMGVKPRDRVLVPNITMMATYAAVKLIGAIPVVIDVDSKNLCMDLDLATSAIEESFFSGEHITAVIYVTLNGRSAGSFDYMKFQLFCKQRKIALIEDNAQSLGSRYLDGYRMSAPDGGIGSFSFSMPKIITTGQGGLLVTNDDDLAVKIKKLKDFGRSSGGNDCHDDFGINSKFTEIQAIMGLNQLKTIEARITKKKEIYNTYLREFVGSDDVKFLDYEDSQHVPWFVDAFVTDRENLVAFLKANGIATRNIYPEIVSQKVHHKNRLWATKSMAVSSIYCNSGLWLPSSLNLTQSEILRICMKIKEFYGN